MNIIKYYYVIFLVFLIGCSTGQFDTSYINIEQKTFKHDLLIEINGEKFIGTGVVKKSNQYDITIFPSDKIERIIYSTCHEEQVIDKPETNGWFKKSISFSIKNVPNVSDVVSCSLEVIVLDEQSRRNAFATIEFQDQRTEVQLPALVKCNGIIKRYDTGVSICQSAYGLIQQIDFTEPVIHDGSKPECEVIKESGVDKKSFTFVMPKGNCTFYFGAQRKINGKRVLHRLQTIGYSEVPFTK